MPTSSVTMAVQKYLSYHQQSDTHMRHLALRDFLSAGPMGASALDTQERRRLTNALLDDLRGLGPAGDDGSEGEGYRLDVLKSLKELSRLPGGSVVQSEPTSLSTLLEQVSIPPAASPPLRRHSSSSSASSGASTTSAAAAATASQGSLGGAIHRAWTKQTSKYRSNSRSRLGTASTAHTPTSTQTFPTATQWEITDVALRCINNALYLHETSRKTFAEERIGGGTKAIGLLRNPWQTPAEIMFLACRLLFFATLFEASFNSRAVDGQGLIECLRDTLDALSVAYARLDKTSSVTARTVPSGNDDQIKAAMAEVLKVIFNLGIYYPRVAASAGNERLGVLLEPVLRLTVLLPPTSLTSPASNAIGVLLNFPVKSNRARWLCTVENLSLASSTSSSPNSTSNSKRKGTAKRVAKVIFSSRHGNRDARSSQSLLLPDGPASSSSSSPSRPTSPTPSFAASIASTSASPPVQQQQQQPSQAGSAHATMTPSSSNASTIRRDWETLSLADALPDDVAPSTLVIEHVVSFLVHFLDKYFPPNAMTTSGTLDPDDGSVRTLANADGIDVEGAAQPLCLLLRNLSAEDEDLRQHIKKTFLPDQLDRTIAPDRRPDTIGKLIRLMGSVTYTRLAQVTSELLFALCKSDAKTMVNEIGYGPCAGFLVSRGLVGAFPEDDAASGSNAHARSINPISGQYDPSESELAQDPINHMTEEEKEAEAERLFGLFDRLNRTGVVKVQHPVRDADEATRSRFEEVDDAGEREEREEREEQQAMREFQAYKARRTSVRK